MFIAGMEMIRDSGFLEYESHGFLSKNNVQLARFEALALMATGLYGVYLCEKLRRMLKLDKI